MGLGEQASEPSQFRVALQEDLAYTDVVWRLIAGHDKGNRCQSQTGGFLALASESTTESFLF